MMVVAFTIRSGRRFFVLNADKHCTNNYRQSHQAASARNDCGRRFEASTQLKLVIRRRVACATSGDYRSSPCVAFSTRRNQFLSALGRWSGAVNLSARQRDGPLIHRTDIQISMAAESGYSGITRVRQQRAGC
jgi:hypothetical protein